MASEIAIQLALDGGVTDSENDENQPFLGFKKSKDKTTEDEVESFWASRYLEKGDNRKDGDDIVAVWLHQVGTLPGDWKCCAICGSEVATYVIMISIWAVLMAIMARVCLKVQ